MRRKETEPLEKRVVNFYEGDFGKLQDLHPRIGASRSVRMLVREHIRRVEAKVGQQASGMPIDATVEPLI